MNCKAYLIADLIDEIAMGPFGLLESDGNGQIVSEENGQS